MDVRVLGPVGVYDGHDLAIGGGQHRRIVAALALRSGEVVSVDRLVDIMWSGDEMPQQPERNLRTYVSRIRSSLGAAHADRLETIAPGYVLHVRADELDAQRFDDQCATAARCLEHDDFDGAIERVAEAMELWRGRPYAEFADEAWARPEVARLEELRASALEVRCSSLLELGRPGEAVAQLEALISEFPLRERPRELYMKALAASGRHVEALRSFRSFRDQLIEEVGIGPSDELVELDRRIACGDQLSDSVGRIRDYERHERIGSGAFADVFRGMQSSLGREVAIKAVRAELANRPEFIRGFEAEAAMVARLEHPHIVPLYDFWREPDRAYLVMRWLTGGSLEGRLDDGPLELGQTAKMVMQIGSALGSAHRAGVVHRDVKSANILFDDDDNTYLSDFGIAVDATTIENPLAALSEGSPAYAAPEQLRRVAVGPAADQFGLAIAVYEALVGSLPFADAKDRAEVLRHQLNDDLPPVRARRADVSASVDEVLAIATAKDADARFDDIDEFVVALTAALGSSPSAPVEVREVARRVTQFPHAIENPYRGLRDFEEGDADNFYGRERLVDELLDSLRGDGRFVAVVGPSGSGKSSAVAAGLVPALRAGRIDGAERWFVTTMTPGAEPFEALEAALLRVAVNPPASLLEQLQSDRRGLVRGVRRIVPDDDDTVVVVIDQFEELFTLVDDESTRSRFLESLSLAVTEPHSSLRVVVTLRADFFDQPLRYGGFAELLKRRSVTVTPLMADELERAIVGPAHATGVEFEPGLVATIVSDVTSGAGSLPLMQFALTKLFDARVSGMLLLSTYLDLGGLTGALALHAEQRFEQLDEAERSAARDLFGRLVALGDGSDDTGRTIRRPEIGQDRALDAVIECFGDARLLTFDRDPMTRRPTVALAHESLIGAWPRLQRWLEHDRERLTVVRSITEASERWRDGGFDDADLLVGGRLEVALDARERSPSRLTGEELTFLERSEEVAAAGEQRRRRRARTLRLALVATSVFLVVAIISGLIAIRQSRRAEDRADAATVAESQAEVDRNAAELAADDAERAADDAEQARQDAVDERELADQAVTALETEVLRARAVEVAAADPAAGALLAVEAYERDPGAASRSTLVESLLAVPSWRGSLSASWVGALPSRSEIVALEGDELVIYEGNLAPVSRVEAPPGTFAGAAVAPDERAIAMIAGDELVVTNLSDGSSGRSAPVSSLPNGAPIAWAADGRHILVAATSPARVAVFAVEGVDVRFAFKAELPESQASESSIVVSHHPTIPQLAVGAGTSVTIFSTAELASGLLPLLDGYDLESNGDAEVKSFPIPTWGRGETLYVGFADGGFVELERGQVTFRRTPDHSALTLVQELTDGSLMMSSAAGATVHDPETLDRRSGPWPGDGTLLGFAAELGSDDLALTHLPLDGSTPSRVTVWSRDVTNPLTEEVPMPEIGAGTASDTYIVPELMVAGEIRGQNGPPLRLDLGERVDFGVGEVTEAEPRPTAHGWAAVVVSDDPDVADASLMSIHDLASGELWSGPFAVGGSPSSAFVTHDVAHVVLWEATGIRVLDARTGEQTALIDHGGSATLWVWLPMGPGPGILTDVSGTSVIFDSETFEVLATGLDLGTQAAFNSTGDRYAGRRGDMLVVGRWNTDTLEVEEEFEILNPGEVVPAFDASGTYIFGGSSKGVQAWDASDGAPIMPLVPGPGAAAWGAESLFQVRDDTYHLWNTDPTTWAAAACEVAGRNLTMAEWEHHMPDDEPYRATCPDFPSPAIE